MKNSVKLVIRKDQLTVEGKARVEFVIYFKGKQYRISSGKNIEPKYWNSELDCVDRKSPDALEINKQLTEKIANYDKFAKTKEVTDAEKALLTASGVDVNSFVNKQGILEHAFLFGILADAVGDKRAKGMDYKQFQDFLKSGNFVPLTEQEESALDWLKQRSYNDITGIGNRIAIGTSNAMLNNQPLTIRDTIKQEAVRAVEMRNSARELAGKLGDLTQEWERDWLRISYYLLHEAFNAGRAENILKEYGSDAEVYFDVFEGACNRCKELYLENPEDDNSKPNVFKLKDVIANGNNIGRKADEWLPTVSPVHPFCRCILNEKPSDMDWNPELRAFNIPVKYVPKNERLKNVKLNITVRKAWEDDFGKNHFSRKPREKDEHNHFIPSPYKVVTEYENAFIKNWNNAMAVAFVDVLKYMSKATKQAIVTKAKDANEFIRKI